MVKGVGSLFSSALFWVLFGAFFLAALAAFVYLRTTYFAPEEDEVIPVVLVPNASPSPSPGETATPTPTPSAIPTTTPSSATAPNGSGRTSSTPTAKPLSKNSSGLPQAGPEVGVLALGMSGSGLAMFGYLRMRQRVQRAARQPHIL